MTCGNQGTQERSIWCQEDINSKQRLEDFECAKHEPKPITRRGCASSPCPTKNQSVPIGPAKTNSVEESLKKYYSWEPGKWSTVRDEYRRKHGKHHNRHNHYHYDVHYRRRLRRQ